MSQEKPSQFSRSVTDAGSRADPMTGTQPILLMAQFLALKVEPVDCLSFHHPGDLLALFFDDARGAGAVFDIAPACRPPRNARGTRQARGAWIHSGR